MGCSANRITAPRSQQLLRLYLKQVIRQELNSSRRHVSDDDSDLVQQALVRAVENLSGFRGNSLDEWKAWLAAIVRNQARASRRFWQADRRSAARQVDAPDAIDGKAAEHSTPSAALIRGEHAAQLQTALAALSESQRQLIRWRQDDGLSYAEIAERLMIGVDAARQRCKAAMDALRQAWKTNEPRS